MATAHATSMIVNSCVKTPVNPRTGLSSTFNERPQTSQSRRWEGSDEECDSDPPENPDFGTIDYESTNDAIENLTQQLSHGDMRNDEFFQKLQTLKNEHRKTLSMYERMYKEKQATAAQENGSPFDPVMGTSRYSSRVNHNKLENEALSHSLNGGFGHSQAVNKSVDNLWRVTGRPSATLNDSVRDMSSKPPRPPTSTHRDSPSRNGLRSSHTFQPSASARSALEDSDEEGPLRGTMGRSFQSDSEDEVHEDYRTPRKAKGPSMAWSQVEDMWDNFSVEDYAPKERRPRAASIGSSTSSRKSLKGSDSEANEWRHRLTIPKPFKMTLRENEVKEKKKTKAMVDLEKRIEEKKKKEDLECQKKFKATPVPAHVYVPLYDEIMEKEEHRRRFIQEYSQEMLKSVEKPFKFMKREEEKKRHRRSNSTSSVPIKKEKQFKARPVPNYLFDNKVSEKQKEEELYRQIRIKMRAEEMLNSASLPPNMAVRNTDYTQSKSKSTSKIDRAKRAGIRTESSFSPKVSESVPNFAAIHRKLQKEFSNKKLEKESTICKPFKLSTSSLTPRKQKVYEDMMRDEETLKETRWPYSNPRARPQSARRTLSKS